MLLAAPAAPHKKRKARSQLAPSDATAKDRVARKRKRSAVSSASRKRPVSNAGDRVDTMVEDELEDDEVLGAFGSDDPNGKSSAWIPKDIPPCPLTLGLAQNIRKSTLPPFKGPAAGPKNLPAGTKTCNDFFLLFFDAKIMNKFVQATNSYGNNKSSSTSPWSFVGASLLLKFFAIILYMGIVKQPTLKSYWSMDEIFKNEWVRKQMSRQEFTRIFSHLHFLDSSSMSDEERTARSKADPFWLVKEFVALLSANFQKFYSCGRF